MPAKTAYRLCPQAIFLPPRFDVYRAVSAQIMTIFKSITSLVEPLSLDEAYLDITSNVSDFPEAVQLARAIKERIREETGLTASAGISFNKLLSKLGSDAHKPDGLTLITNSSVRCWDRAAACSISTYERRTNDQSSQYASGNRSARRSPSSETSPIAARWRPSWRTWPNRWSVG